MQRLLSRVVNWSEIGAGYGGNYYLEQWVESSARGAGFRVLAESKAAVKLAAMCVCYAIGS